MIILRAIPLSFVILVLFLPMIPVLVVVMISYLIVSFVLGIVIFPFSPALAVLIVIGVYLAWNVVPTMVGTRMALKTKGIEPNNTYSQLLFPTVAYGFFEALVNVLVVVLAVIAFIVFSTVTFDEVISQVISRRDMAIDDFVKGDPGLVYGLVGTSVVIATAFRAALLVPFASASVGRDPGSRLYTPLVNFGAGFVPLLVISLLAYASFYYAGEIGRQVAIWLGYGKEVKGALVAIDTAIYGGGITSLKAADWVVLLTSCLITLWMFSLQCAGASLVYLRLNERALAAAEADTAVQRMEQEEVRALWKDRMPGG